MRVADWIMKRLADEGLRHMFLLPGGGAMHLNDALACEPRITPIPCHHEQACGIAAEAYGRTGHADNPGFGVALVTTGPGTTNIITPVAGAWIDSLPLLVLSGGVKRGDRLSGRELRQAGVQEVDIIPLVSHITKFSATLNHPEEISLLLGQALKAMRSGRPGPVWLEIPLDLQGAVVNSDFFESSSVKASEGFDIHDSGQIQRLWGLLEDSSRPLILAGHGIRLSNAVDLFREFVEKAQIPVVSTWNALDLIPADNPLYIGTPGVVALRAPNFAIQNCDLLISIGCRLDNIITAYNPQNFAANAVKIVVDIDQNELVNHAMDIKEKVHADAGSFIKSLLNSCSASSSNYKEG